MSLQFIFGNSGSGKSHYLYQHIVEESVKHPEKNYLVLVPEQFTMQTQKDLCQVHPRPGILPDPLPHLLCRLVGKCDRGDIRRLHLPVFQQITEP